MNQSMLRGWAKHASTTIDTHHDTFDTHEANSIFHTTTGHKFPSHHELYFLITWVQHMSWTNHSPYETNTKVYVHKIHVLLRENSTRYGKIHCHSSTKYNLNAFVCVQRNWIFQHLPPRGLVMILFSTSMATLCSQSMQKNFPCPHRLPQPP